MKSEVKEQLDFGLWDAPELLAQPHPQILSMTDGEVVLYHNFFGQEESDKLFQALSNEIKWRQDKIKYYGKEIALPRLTAWYGNSESYTYSGISMNPERWTSILLSIKSRIEKVAKVNFNSVLLNLYRGGKDSVSWHSDNEPELGENPVIGSVSFGETRPLQFRHRLNKDLTKVTVNLTHGSFLLMKGATQRFWQHQIPKTSRLINPRINLTFRVINHHV